MIRDSARRLVARAAIHNPRALYRIAGGWSRLTPSLDPRPVSVEDLQAVFPGLTAADAVRVAREIRAAAVKSRLLAAALSGTSDPAVFPTVRLESPETALAPQAVFVGFHFGPVGALGDVLRRSSRRVVAMHKIGWPPPPNTTYLAAGADEAGRVLAFREALYALREGQCAFLLADDRDGIRVPLLAGTITMRRGAFALARLTGVPVVPLLPRWKAGQVHVRVGPALAPQTDEGAMAVAVASVLEAHLMEHPHAIGRKLLAELANQIRAQDRPLPIASLQLDTTGSASA